MIERSHERTRSKSHSRKPPVPTVKKKDPLLNEIFFDKYKTIKKLGEGSFGKVYKAEYNGEYYALKFESRSRTKSLLEMESTVMAYLQGPNIPYIKSYGYSDDYNLLVMQYMDKSLEDILHIRKTFSIKTTAMIGFQLIGVLHYIHDKNYIHRDVKPDNCVMGSDELNENLYLIDFGLAKKYRSSRTLKQYPMTRKKKLTGTARYASIHALEGFEQSRRDDIEAVGYVMAYLLRGGLPWQGLKIKTKENKYKNILEKKKEISSEELFKGFPIEFAEILDNVKKLEYLEEPEYEMLRNKLMSLCKRLNYKFDYIYDWTTDKDLLKRKEKRCFTSIKTQSTLSVKNKKRPKSKKKVKYFEKSVDELRHKNKKRKAEKIEENDIEINGCENKEEKEEKEEKENNEDIKVEIIDVDEQGNNKEENKNDEENNDEDKDENNNNEEKKDNENDKSSSKNEKEKEKEKNSNDNDKDKENKNDDNSDDNNTKEIKKNEINIINDEFNTIEKNNEEENEKKSIESNKAIGSHHSQENKNKANLNCIETKEKDSNESKENEEVIDNKEGSKKSKSNCAEIGEEEIVEDTEKSVCCIL